MAREYSRVAQCHRARGAFGARSRDPRARSSTQSGGDAGLTGIDGGWATHARGVGAPSHRVGVATDEMASGESGRSPRHLVEDTLSQDSRVPVPKTEAALMRGA